MIPQPCFKHVLPPKWLLSCWYPSSKRQGSQLKTHPWKTRSETFLPRFQQTSDSEFMTPISCQGSGLSNRTCTAQPISTTRPTTQPPNQLKLPCKPVKPATNLTRAHTHTHTHPPTPQPTGHSNTPTAQPPDPLPPRLKLRHPAAREGWSPVARKPRPQSGGGPSAQRID